LKKEYHKIQERVAEKATKMKEIKKQIDSLIKAISLHNNQYNTLESQQEQLRNKRHTVYLTFKREDIVIPFLEGSASLPEDVEPDSPEDLSKLLREEDHILVDFNPLPKKLKIFNKSQVDEALTLYQAHIKELTLQLENIAPNMKAMEHLKEVESRLDETNSKFEDSKKSALEAIDEFKVVKEDRIRRFMKAFDHISKQIDIIYKDLTGGAGAAYLTLENLEEPYLHGITYNPMPPKKNFGDIQNLSGGEKSVAALALLFAIHSYKPAPFFILDEIDAALDPSNVSMVGKYIRDRSKEIQFILISLKNRCYERADGLVGVCINGVTDSSDILTFDLSPFSF